jgi:hypothetical protein
LLTDNVKLPQPDTESGTGILKSETCSEVPTFQTGFQKMFPQKQSLETETVCFLPVSNSLDSSYLSSKYSLYFWSNFNCMYDNANKNKREDSIIEEKSEEIISRQVKYFDVAYSIVSRLAVFGVASLATWMCYTGNPNVAYVVGIANIFLKASQTQTVAPDYTKEGSSKSEDEQ